MSIGVIYSEVVETISSQVSEISSTIDRIKQIRRRFNDSRYYDVRMLTKIFNMSKSFIHLLVRHGDLPAVKIGGKYVFLKDDVEQVLKQYDNGDIK